MGRGGGRGAHRETGMPFRKRDQNGHVDVVRSERSTGSEGQPPVLILIENASVEKVARAHVYTRVPVHAHASADTDATSRRPEATRERQRPGKRPRGAVVRGGNSI